MVNDARLPARIRFYETGKTDNEAFRIAILPQTTPARRTSAEIIPFLSASKGADFFFPIARFLPPQVG